VKLSVPNANVRKRSWWDKFLKYEDIFLKFIEKIKGFTSLIEMWPYIYWWKDFPTYLS